MQRSTPWVRCPRKTFTASEVSGRRRKPCSSRSVLTSLACPIRLSSQRERPKLRLSISLSATTLVAHTSAHHWQPRRHTCRRCPTRPELLDRLTLCWCHQEPEMP